MHQDIYWMQQALDAAHHSPAVDPNPRVGCVLVDPEGRHLATGWHRGAGTPHAEVEALRQAERQGRSPAGATAYVTLEPCHHTGRTGPCSRALDQAGVSRVVVAQLDPNPAATGGADWLAATGIRVETGVLAEAAAELNRTWSHWIRTGRPWVSWKFAATLDGRTAAPDGSSQWITGPQARADVHRRRAGCGAIMVGTGTVIADDPHLTVRDELGSPVARQPLRVVLGERDIPATARVLDDAAETLCLRTHDLPAALAEIGRRGVHHVWLEGGTTVGTAFLTAGLVDELITYLAPAVLGSAASPAVGDLGITSVTQKYPLRLIASHTIGGDLCVISRPYRSTEGD